MQSCQCLEQSPINRNFDGFLDAEDACPAVADNLKSIAEKTCCVENIGVFAAGARFPCKLQDRHVVCGLWQVDGVCRVGGHFRDVTEKVALDVERDCRFLAHIHQDAIDVKLLVCHSC